MSQSASKNTWTDIAVTLGGSEQLSLSKDMPSQRLSFPHCFANEILVMIFRHVLILPRKIRLINDPDDVAVSNICCPLKTCEIGRHTSYLDINGNSSTRQHYMCHDLYSNATRKLRPNRSVLDFLLVNRQINIIATKVFFAENKFVFRDLVDVCKICIRIGEARANHIHDISFQYTSSKANEKYYWLIRLLPNLTHLSLNLDIRSKDIRKNKAGNLKTCQSMKEVIHALSGLKVVNLYGCDYALAYPDDPKSPKVIQNVNHPRTAGPWIG